MTKYTKKVRAKEALNLYKNTLHLEVIKLWDNISDFEKHETKNDSKNPILSNARQSARMDAYTKLQDKILDDKRLQTK